jgi:hypothetical protein
MADQKLSRLILHISPNYHRLDELAKNLRYCLR